MAGNIATVKDNEGDAVKRILTLLSCMALAGLVFQSYIKGQAGLPLYHWVTANEVLLWRSADDDQLVTATVNLENGQWTLTPNKPAEAWRPILQKVILNYETNADLEKISDDQLWTFVLTKLHNEFNTTRWAQARKPSIEVYLSPAAEKSDVAFIPENGGAVGRVTASFTKKSTGVWAKSGPLDLNQLLGVADDPNELSRVFKLGSSGKQQWNQVWDIWITSFLNDNQSVRHFMYRDAHDQLRWLWRERLALGTQLPVTNRRTPNTSTKLSEPTIPTIGKGGSETSSQSFLLSVIVSAGILSVLLGSYFFGLPLFTAITWLARKLAKISVFALEWSVPKLSQAVNGVERKHLGSTEDSLNVIHNLAVEQYKEKFKTDEATGSVLIAALNLAHQQYIAVAKTQKLFQDADAYRASIISEYCQKDLGVAAEDSGKIKNWIELGRPVENSVAQILEMKLPDEVKKQFGDKDLIGKWSPGDWVIQWPRVITALCNYSNESQQECDKLRKDLKDADDEHTQAMKDQRQELDARWQARIAELNDKITARDNDITQANASLESQRKTIQELNNNLAARQTDVSTLSANLNATQIASSDMQKKISELKEVNKLSRRLRQQLQGYYYSRAKSTNDIGETRNVAVVATLINYSLYQICFSIIENLPDLKRVVAHNIFLLTKMFDRPYDRYSDFAQIHENLNLIAPQVENVTKELKAEQCGGETLDDPFFRGLLSWLKTDTGKNLYPYPFFIDLDRQKNTLVFVRVS
jgi:uncharacterized coiled-coil protein SlyX